MINLDAVLFDLDNTLLDRRASFRAFAAAFIRERVSEENRLDDMERMIDFMEELDGDGYKSKYALYETLIARWAIRGVTARELVEGHADAFSPFTTPDPDMAEVLDALSGTYKLGLVTNGLSKSQHGKIDSLGIRNRFDAIVVSGDVGIHKPDPRLFQLCLSQLEVASERAVYVGDHYENDMCGARCAGIRAIWYTKAAKNANVPVAHRLRDILDYLSEK